MADDFSNLAKDINIQIWEAEKTPSRINRKNSMPSHSIIELIETKDKEKILKIARDK